MALGNVYLVPEQGWNRINNDNENFEYINMSKKVYSDKTNFYLGDVHFSQDLTKYSAVKFNIIGKQFRLLNQIYTTEGRNMNLNIIIDGVTIKHSSPLGQVNGHACYYESPIWDNKEHSIIIEHFGTDEGYISFDIVDIADNGIIKKYNPYIFKKYLINQNKNYYSTNSNFLNLGQPIDNIQLENWYNKYGSGDVNIITQNLNNKEFPMSKNENGIWKTDFQLDINHVTDNIDLVDTDENNKSIKYNCNDYKILDLCDDQFKLTMCKTK
ncbi:hypothetical protein [Clostridium botulinum]|uniref:hypothetical protein n=1 Tax=Clostridium botulinum TaxID=1491 RepID=UPI001FA8A7D1|nr:hypothetical protein [Clostridium botulinum]